MKLKAAKISVDWLKPESEKLISSLAMHVRQTWSSVCLSSSLGDLQRVGRRYVRKAMLLRISDWVKYLFLLMIFSLAMNVL